MGQIEQCAASGNLGLYTTLAHALKGASRSVGAAEFGEVAAQMENAARTGDEEVIARETGAFLASARELASGIRHSIKRDDSGCPQDGEDLTYYLIEPMRHALKSMDITSANRLIVEYYSLNLNERARKNMSEIENHILMFDYDKAIEIMDSLNVS